MIRKNTELDIMENGELDTLRKPNLTYAQRELYILIARKLNNNKKIYLDDARKIYVSKVCRNKSSDGKPQKQVFIYSEKRKSYSFRWENMTNHEIACRSIMWLTANIGSLVLKGHLTIVPQIEINQVV